MAEDHSYTSADEWAEDSDQGLPSPLNVPSGKTALVRAPGLEAFLKAGMIPNSLMGMMRKALDTNKGKAKTAAQERREMDAMFDAITKDPTKLEDLFTLVDSATVFCVVKPEVRAVPMVEVPAPSDEEPGKKKLVEMPIEDRPPQIDENGKRLFLWVDQVDLQDKMFIFNFACAGTRDAERFLEQSADVLGRTGDGKSVAPATKRTVGSTKGKGRPRKK